MYMKKIIPITFLILSIFSACINENGKQNKTTDKTFKPPVKSIKIKWLGHWFGEGKKETLLRELAREFNFLHQDIQVELEFPHQMLGVGPEVATYLMVVDSISRMIEDNDWPYEIMLCDAYRYQAAGIKINKPDWGKDYLIDFKQFPWFIDSHKDGIFSDNRYTYIFADMATGPFIEGVWNLLYVSSVMEQKLGIEIKDYDMNMSDFELYAKKVYEYNQSHSDKISFLTFPRTDMTPFFNHIVMSAVGKDSVYNSEEALENLKLTYKSLEKIAPYKPFEHQLEYQDDKTLYYNQALFIYNPSWVNLFWQSNNPDAEKTMKPCEIPSIDGKKASSYSGRYTSVFVAPKNSKNPDAAVQFLKFISSKETASKWTKYSKCPTGLKEGISYSDFGVDLYTKFSQHISNKYNNKLNEDNSITAFLDPDKKIDFKFALVMNGEISAQEAYESVIAQLKAYNE